MRAKTSQGQGIRCSQCGGRFPLQTIAAAVACPFCGARQDLASHTVQVVRAYRENVFAEMRAADSERQAAAAWGQWSGGSGGHKIWLWAMVAMMGIPAFLTLPMFLLSGPASSALPAEVVGGLGTAFGLCTPLVMVAVMVSAAVYQARRTKAPTTRLQPGGARSVVKKVACPHCGGPNHLAVGQALQNCGHCQGALMPSRTIMVEGLDLAKQARRHASLERYRTERRGWVGVQSYMGSYRLLMPLFYAVAVGPVVLSMLFIPAAFLGELDPRPRLAVGLFVLLLVAMVMGVAAFFAMRWWTKRRAFADTLADLAAQFHGRSSEKLEDLVGWLDTFWAGPYEGRFLGSGSPFGAVSVDAWGYPAMISVHLRGADYLGHAAHTPRYCRVLLAAWLPSRSEGGPPPPLDAHAQRTMQWLSDAGFDVSCEEGGLLAHAREDLVRRLTKEPAALHSLAPVVGHLARLAREVGASAVGPMP